MGDALPVAWVDESGGLILALHSKPAMKLDMLIHPSSGGATSRPSAFGGQTLGRGVQAGAGAVQDDVACV